MRENNSLFYLEFIMNNNLEANKNVSYWDHRSHEYAELFYESQHRIEVMMRLNSFLPKKINALLDLGCGNGIVTEYILNSRLPQKPNEIHLLDLSPNMLKQARKRLKIYNAFYYQLPMECDLPFNDHTFDVIISSFSMHHINDVDKLTVFKNLHRVLAKNGTLVIADEIIFADHLSEVPSEEMMKLFYPNKNAEFYCNTFSDLVEYPSKINVLEKMILEAGFDKYFFERYSDITGIIFLKK